MKNEDNPMDDLMAQYMSLSDYYKSEYEKAEVERNELAKVSSPYRPRFRSAKNRRKRFCVSNQSC